MSIRIVFVMLVAAVSMAFGFMPANAQQPQMAQPPQSLRLYVLDCGKITPANADAYGLKSSEMATVNMITPCFLIVHPRGTMIWDTGEISDSAFKDGVSPQKLNTFTVDRPLLPQLAAIGYIPATSLIWRSPTTMPIMSPTPACSPVQLGLCRRATGTGSSPRGRPYDRQ